MPIATAIINRQYVQKDEVHDVETNEVDDVKKGTRSLFPDVTLLNFIYIFPRVYIFYMCYKEFFIDEQSMPLTVLQAKLVGLRIF